jgi:hypothetical protein
MYISWVPIFEMAGVGIASHVIERKLEYSGHGGRVIYLRIATYLTCGLISFYAWRELFRYAGILLGVHGSW